MTFGGALFAAFPEAYASIFSAFYTLVMLLLAMLILRATSIEFRGKFDSPPWHAAWDARLLPALVTFLMGLAVGNAMTGIPLNSRGEYIGSFWDLFSPYSVLVGFLAIAMFTLHGEIYLYLKAPVGELHRAHRAMGLELLGNLPDPLHACNGVYPSGCPQCRLQLPTHACLRRAGRTQCAVHRQHSPRRVSQQAWAGICIQLRRDCNIHISLGISRSGRTC